MLKERLFIGFVGASFVCLVLISENLMLSIAVSIITLMGLSELYGALGYFKKNIPLAVFGYIQSLIILFFNFASESNITFMHRNLMLMIFIYVIVLFVYMVLSHPKTTFSDIGMCFLSTFYITMFLSYLVLIRKGTDGKFLIWIPLIIAWLSDTMAFTFGKLFGKHKLIPTVSPKKTVEGAVGGLFGGAFFMLVFGLVSSYFFGKPVNYINMIILGVIGSVVAQFGDLAASCIKRECNIKDFGNILPGHGGILDRFDSVIVVGPFVYYFLMVFPVFG